MDLRRLRRFVGAVDAGEVFQLTAPGFGVETFDVAPFAFVERGVDVNFNEFTVG